MLLKCKTKQRNREKQRIRAAEYGINSLTGAKTITHDEETLTGVTYTGYITDYANNTSTCSITVKQKKIYVLTYNNNSGSGCSSRY